METGIGIVLLAVFAIGAASILLWVARQLANLSSRFVKPSVVRKTRYLKIGHMRTLTPYDQVPQYKGDTWFFGLPCYKDVIVPDKHNYATVVYMDHPVKQWVYDVIANWKESCNAAKEEGKFKTTLAILFFPGLLLASGASPYVILIAMAVIFAVMYLWMGPTGMPMTRRSAENAKDFTPDTWRKIYKDVAESQEREDEMVRAIRRSGVRRL